MNSQPTVVSHTLQPARQEGKRALLALSCDSREAVQGMMASALANGGAESMPPQDHGFMYSHSFRDPDGHIWELMWMDPGHVQPQ